MTDTNEEIDTCGIEEQDWIECMKRSTVTAVEKMKAARIPCWIETRQRKPQNGTQAPAPSTRQTDQWEDQERDEKMN